jgi:hypothetical protein
MCSQLCSNLRIEGIRIRLNKTESREDYKHGFQSLNWYMNLSEKMSFLRKNMDHIGEGEAICVSDADIQFFKPNDLLRMKSIIESSDLDYMGQRERDEDIFNGGFFLIKKNPKTIDFIDKINSEDLTKYEHAEQDVINRLISPMDIRYRFLSRLKYLNGCMRFSQYVCPKIADAIVMHHATCAFNSKEKMEQMNFVRSQIGLDPINWSVYTGVC